MLIGRKFAFADGWSERAFGQTQRFFRGDRIPGFGFGPEADPPAGCLAVVARPLVLPDAAFGLVAAPLGSDLPGGLDADRRLPGPTPAAGHEDQRDPDTGTRIWLRSISN